MSMQKEMKVTEMYLYCEEFTLKKYQVKKHTNTTSLFFLLFLFYISNKLISEKGNELVNVTTIPGGQCTKLTEAASWKDSYLTRQVGELYFSLSFLFDKKTK